MDAKDVEEFVEHFDQPSGHSASSGDAGRSLASS